MERTHIVSKLSKAHIEHLHQRKHHSETRKRELIEYLEKLKESYKKGLVSYSKYLETIHLKRDGRTIEEWIHFYHFEVLECHKKIQHYLHSRTKKRFFIYIIAIIAIIALFSFVLNNSRFAGFVAQENQTSSPSRSSDFSEQLNLKFSKTDTYKWTPENKGNLTFTSLFGVIEETKDSNVKIYLNDILILDSSNIKESKQRTITALAVDETPDEESKENLAEDSTAEESQSEKVGEVLPEDSSPSLDESLPPSEDEIIKEQEENTTEIPEANESETSNEKEAKKIIKEFENFCQDTCDLKDLQLNKDYYELRIEIYGDAEVKISTIKYGIVSEENLSGIQANQTEIIETIEANATITTTQERAVIGQPVKWTKKIELDNPSSVTITIPAEAENITAYKIEDENRGISEEKTKVSISGMAISSSEGNGIITQLWSFIKRIFASMTGRVIEPELTEITLNDNATDYEITYETEAPQAEETLTSKGKQIVITGPDEIHYQDILAFTTLEKESPVSKIKLYHLVNDSKVPVEITTYDNNENGLIDYIEWTVPHLSEQKYELIIEITSAEHLDENKNFIQDITDIVKTQDNNWSPTINENEYVRVTFEKNLTSVNDITIYPRIISGNPRIEIYEVNGTEIIAEFTSINENDYNKVYLTNLISESQDTFDLRVVDGSLEFDYIVDPEFFNAIPIENCSAQSYDSPGSFAESCDYPDGSALIADGSYVERHTYGKTGAGGKRGGVKTINYNPDIDTCTNISNVTICYEWWATRAGLDCEVSYSIDNGTTWIPITTTCPGTTPNPGLTCVDVTINQTWNCTHFFGTEGVKAQLRSDLNRESAGGPTTEIATWDALYFNVEHYLSSNAPYWSNNQTYPQSNSTYSPNQNYRFNVTWQDDYWVENVTIEHNFTGIPQNYSVSNISSVYSYNYSDLPAGIYYWKMYANDSENQINSTNTFEYIIKKNQSILNLYLNSTEFNFTIYENESVNITAILSNPSGKEFYLYNNGTLINQGTNYLTNITLFENIGPYNITSIFPGNENYTSSSKTYYVKVQSSAETDPPVITVIYPSHNQTIKNPLFLNITTDENSFCKYSTNESFNFTTQGTLLDSTGSIMQHSTNLGTLADGNYIYYIKCNDTLGNTNNQTNQANATFIVDNTPPGTITNLNSPFQGYTWIYWNWTNPIDADFNYSILYLNGTNIENTSLNYYNATNLIPSTAYNLSIQTADNAGNINTTLISNIQSTLIDNIPVINNISATPRVYYDIDTINFTANVTDDINITQVILTVHNQNYTMNYEGNDIYTYNNLVPISESGVYDYTVTAFDNYRSSQASGTFTVIAIKELDYYEHDASRIFNQTPYQGVLQNSTINFPNAVETKAWNFTKDYAEDYGGLFIMTKTIIFTGGFAASTTNDRDSVYISWEIVHLNTTSQTETTICKTPNGTNGQLITTTAMGVYSASCTPASNYYIPRGDKVRVNIYGYNSANQARNIIHYWDTLATGSEYLIGEVEIGNITVNLTEPSSNISLNYGDSQNITCSINCTGGACYSIFSWLEYKNETGWNNVSYSLNDSIYLNENCSNPKATGTVPEGIYSETFRIFSNNLNENLTLRCRITDDYNPDVYSNERGIYLVDNSPPNTTLISPENNYENETLTQQEINFTCSATDNYNLSNISLYLTNNQNQSFSLNQTSIVSNKSNSSTWITNLSIGNYTWNCLACDNFNNCAFASENYTIKIFEENVAPNITYVSPIPNTNPIEISSTPVTFFATINDSNGANDINLSSMNANFTRAGQTTRENLSCINISNIDSYSINVSCTINMWYFDEAGNWNISVYAEDNEGLSAINDSTYFQYNQLQALTITPNNLNFSVQSNAINQLANNNPMTINNTGNANLTNKIAIQAFNLLGESNPLEFINASNISANIINDCTGDRLENATDTNITGVILQAGNLSLGGGVAQEELYYCINEVGSISSQTYSTQGYGSWIIKIVLSLVMVSTARKKKRKIIVDDLSIPASIFTDKIGGLEALVKYLKENLELTYHEIALLLNRNDRTIWTAYNKSQIKMPEKLKITKTLVHIPSSIFKNRKLTIFEAIVVYLKEKEMKYSEIGKLLNRDQRNIWTIYNRSIQK